MWGWVGSFGGEGGMGRGAVHEKVGWGEGCVGWRVDVEGVEGGFARVGD